MAVQSKHKKSPRRRHSAEFQIEALGLGDQVGAQ